MFISLELA